MLINKERCQTDHTDLESFTEMTGEKMKKRKFDILQACRLFFYFFHFIVLTGRKLLLDVGEIDTDLS
jgi:hypothetical protein